MGLRFRKSVKVGPMRVNISKSGVGYSVGGKGYRVTKKANGGMRTTASIPGTGISYVKDYSTKTSTKTTTTATRPTPVPTSANVSGSDTSLDKYCPNCYRMLEDGAKYCTKCGHAIGSQVKKPIHKRWWFILIVGLLCLRACGTIFGTEPAEQDAPTTESVIQSMETTVPTAAPTETVAPTSAATRPTVSVSGDVKKVTYILNTDTKVFHKPSCHHAEKMKGSNRQERTDQRSSIINAGYTPCGTCDP